MLFQYILSNYLVSNLEGLQKTHKHHIKSILHNKIYFYVFIIYYIYMTFSYLVQYNRNVVFKKKMC